MTRTALTAWTVAWLALAGVAGAASATDPEMEFIAFPTADDPWVPPAPEAPAAEAATVADPPDVAPAAAPAETTASADEVTRAVETNRRELLRSSLDAPEADPSAGSLEDLMRQIRAIRLGGKPKPPPLAPTEDEVPEAAPPTAPPAEAPGAEDDAPEAPAAPPSLTADQLAALRALPLEAIDRPVTVADALFMGGFRDEAHTLYERLLARERETAAEAARAAPPAGLADEAAERAARKAAAARRAWLLFQMGNCRRASAPEDAIALYGRVVAEYPESAWAPVAQATRTLLEWRRTSPRAKAAPAALAAGPATSDVETP